MPKPGSFDFVGKAKWAAWKNLEGTAKDQAEAQYIALIDELAGADVASGQTQTMESCEFRQLFIPPSYNVHTVIHTIVICHYVG